MHKFIIRWLTVTPCCNPLTRLLRFVLDLPYNLFLHCYAAVSKILTDAPCGPSAVAELLVLIGRYIDILRYCA